VKFNELLTPYRITLAAITMAASVVTLYGIYSLALSPVASVASPKIVAIPSGAGALAISRILDEAGIIRSAFAFRLYITFHGLARELQAGSYAVCPCESTRDIAQAIASGDALSTDISLTIPEGMNAWEIDELLTQRGLILAGSFARQFYNEEGSFFPDTYRFDASVASQSLVYGSARRYADAMRVGFANKASSYTREQVIIASMLEKEAKTAEDMRIVAGIIAQRRQLGMLLQIDATVAYGWCLARWLPMSSSRNCDVTQAPIAFEIKKDGPYNTYMRTGLPVGPIANPGLRALDAAANPQPSEYLYYLSTRDGSQLIYSKTLAEHNRNRAKYLGL
jgi:UPF0755 protein